MCPHEDAFSQHRASGHRAVRAKRASIPDYRVVADTAVSVQGDEVPDGYVRCNNAVRPGNATVSQHAAGPNDRAPVNQ